MIRVRFWGVRGSIPTPGDKTVRYGGNTSCIEIRYGEGNDIDTIGNLIIVDAGTGIRLLGDRLMGDRAATGRPVVASLFLTHTHWDHIMGFPFFTPIYVPGTRLDMYGPVALQGESLQSLMSNQLSYQYFPVRLGELAADIRYRELREEKMELGGGMTVRTKYLNHPVLCLGYRFEYGGSAVCTAFDTETFRNLFAGDPSTPGYDADAAAEGEAVAREENDRVREFYRGADLLIHDAQYTAPEYEARRRGWGHTTFEDAVENGVAAAVKHLVLFHHDPERGDLQLDEILAAHRKTPAEHGFTLDLPREALVVDLD